jgi:hypothetical protein
MKEKKMSVESLVQKWNDTTVSNRQLADEFAEGDFSRLYNRVRKASYRNQLFVRRTPTIDPSAEATQTTTTASSAVEESTATDQTDSNVVNIIVYKANNNDQVQRSVLTVEYSDGQDLVETLDRVRQKIGGQGSWKVIETGQIINNTGTNVQPGQTLRFVPNVSAG